MGNAKIDENGVRSLLGVLDTDGATLVPIKANATTHRLRVRFGTSGSDLGPTNAPRDENDVPALMGVSEVDGKTPVVIYADADGRLLLDNS